MQTINFGLELEDNMVDLIEDICDKWTRYASENKIRDIPLLYL